jgi:hypothetical protein
VQFLAWPHFEQGKGGALDWDVVGQCAVSPTALEAEATWDVATGKPARLDLCDIDDSHSSDGFGTLPIRVQQKS